MSTELVCSFCGKPILDDRYAWKEMRGWVSPMGAKGLTLSQPTGEYAHAACINLQKSGNLVGQESLL